MPIEPRKPLNSDSTHLRLIESDSHLTHTAVVMRRTPKARLDKSGGKGHATEQDICGKSGDFADRGNRGSEPSMMAHAESSTAVKVTNSANNPAVTQDVGQSSG